MMFNDVVIIIRYYMTSLLGVLAAVMSPDQRSYIKIGCKHKITAIEISNASQEA
jgi:hypothetical protein